MTRALIDTNIIIDALASREPFRADAEQLFLYSATNSFAGYITASSLTDIYYIVRKYTDAMQSKEAIRHLLNVFSVIDVAAVDCQRALDLVMPDYEDALQVVCALKAQVDFIVTRDVELIQQPCPIPIVQPGEFLARTTFLQ